MEHKHFEQERYFRAQKKVKSIKGFYSHALVYVVINLMIVVINLQNLEQGESYFQWHNFTTLGFWGIGLLAHGLSVFMPSIILGKDWEERKIKELMEKNKNRWE
ncbi:2TM domain-containing protein [Flavobacteriaceae bacterium LMO-SS05]